MCHAIPTHRESKLPTPLSWSASLLLIALAGCAGGSISRVGDEVLPKDLPTDMIEKFEVKEVSGPVAKPSSLPLAEVAPAGPLEKGTLAKSHSNAAPVAAKKSAAKKGAAATPASAEVPGPFVFPERRPPSDPIWLGEQQTFEVTYFGMAAAKVVVDVLPYKEMNNRKVYHLKGTATSSPVFSMFYKVNDTVESFMDYGGLFSHRFHLLLDESKQTRDALELHDSEKQQTYYWNRWNHHKKGYSESKEFQPMIPFSQDSLSAIFYMRFHPMPQDAVLTFPVVSEGKGWEAVITVIRREMIDTPMGKIRAIVVKPETKYQGVLQKKGDSYMWLSDDDRRFLLKLEAKVRIGTVVAVLKDIKKGTPP